MLKTAITKKTTMLILGSLSIRRKAGSANIYSRGFSDLHSGSNKAVGPTDRRQCYTCPDTLAVTVVPSGNTTIKNWFIGPATVDCSLRSLATEKSPLTISERVKLPKESRFRTLGIATTIAATITDNRIKAILCKFVRLIVQIGCRIDPPLTRLPIFISLDMRRTRDQ